MALGILGQKLGMTQIFQEDGLCVPVTVVEVHSNTVVQKKTLGVDGYTALQLAVGEKRSKLVNKPAAGHLKKAGLESARVLREFRVDQAVLAKYNAGDKLGLDFLNDVKSIDVSGISKGKGTAGVMKRHNMSGFRATHGTHEYFRHGGSIGCRAKPGKVHRGKRMAGRMGNERVTVINLAIVKTIPEQNLICLRGAVPGAKGGFLEIRPSLHAAKRGRRMRAELQEKSKNPMKASKAGAAKGGAKKK